MKRKYSFLRAIRFNYINLYSLLGFIIFLLSYLLISLRGFNFFSKDTILLFMSFIFLVWFIFNIRDGKYLFNNGLEIEAKIINVTGDFIRAHRGGVEVKKVEYSYEINGKTFKDNYILPKNGNIKINDIKKILVHPINNEKNILLEFLCKIESSLDK